jgi:two-component system, NarL family, response regulator NreC
MNDPYSVPGIRVLLADDHMVVRAGLKSLLGAEPDIRVIAEVSNGADAVSYAMRFKPDVVVMDLSMPGQDGIEATKEIVAKAPNVRVLVLTVHPEDESLVAAMKAGASGYLLKSEADREIAAAVRTVSRGERYLRPRAERILAGTASAGENAASEIDRYRLLTERERSVLRYVALGHTAAEIASQLHISPKSVDTYKRRIADKLSLTHRWEYVSFAYKLGLLQSDHERDEASSRP